jgi:protein-disulfide isomerase
MPRLTRHLLVVTALAAALGACSKPDATPAPTPSAGTATVTSTGDVSAAPTATAPFKDSTSTAADRGRIRGAEGATVWLVEISDFQCPFCKRWHDETYTKIDREYVQTGKIRLAYINFPLASIHPNARAAAEAAMCASAQNRFWPLHESLFATQERWAAQKNPMPIFDSLAVAAGTNAPAWRTCMSTHATLPIIEADRDRAARSGVQSTPSFFIGNRGLVGSYPVDTFRVVLDSALAHARAGH